MPLVFGRSSRYYGSTMPPSARRTRGQSRSPIAITLADDAILRALLRYHYLTSVQLCRLLYSPRSLTYVRDRLRRLVDARVVQKSFIPCITGHPPATFSLARRGLTYLAEAGLAVPKRARPYAAQESFLHAKHT